MEEKMGAALNLFWLNKGALKVQKEGLGGGGRVFFNKSKKLSFAILWYYI